MNKYKTRGEEMSVLIVHMIDDKSLDKCIALSIKIRRQMQCYEGDLHLWL